MPTGAPEMIDTIHNDNTFCSAFFITQNGMIMDRMEMMRCFVAVAEQGSFAAAARRLGLSGAALTRHVAGLEDHLGAQLLRRTTRAVSLTDDGAQFLDRARGILAEFEEARRALERDSGNLTGRLVVTAPVIFGRLHVAPILSVLAQAHPRLEIELQVTDRIESLVGDGIDAAFRIGTLADSGDVAQRVGRVRRVLVGAPDYLAGAPPLGAPRDLLAHRLIRFQPLTPAGHWTFYPEGRALTQRPAAAFATNSADIAIAEALRGGGLCLALSYQVHEHLQAGRLVRLLPDCEPPEMPIHLVSSPNRHGSARVQALRALIGARAGWDFGLGQRPGGP